MKRASVSSLAAILLGTALLGGCLEAPTVEETWTKLEVVSMTPSTSGELVGQTDVAVDVRARITFRELLTGFLVADLRASTIPPADVDLEDDPDDKEDALDAARDVDSILQNSVSLGVDAVAITGFDHLIRELDLGFDASVPADSAAGLWLYLLVYFSSDVEELEDERGNDLDSLHVVPTFSTERDILSTGTPIAGAPAAP